MSLPLGEIVRFIEHKVNHCRNNLQSCHGPTVNPAPEDSDPEDALALKSRIDKDSKIHSVPSNISAPINKRNAARLDSPPLPHREIVVSPIELKATASSTPKRKVEEGGTSGVLEDLDERGGGDNYHNSEHHHHHHHHHHRDEGDVPKEKKAKIKSVDADTNTVNSGEFECSC